MRKSKKVKKVKKLKKLKTKSLMAKPRKVGRPKKVKKVSRPRKVKVVKETKREKMQKVAKLGKRKYKKAVEQMAMEKISKKIRRKGRGNGLGNGVEHGEAVSVKTLSYEKYSKVAAGPNISPEGVTISAKKNEETLVVPILEMVKKRLMEKGYKWKDTTFKVVEKTPAYWTVEFVDKKQGEVTSMSSILQHKQEEDIATGKAKKDPKLSKVELKRYVKKLVEHGHKPQDIKVLENKPDYFTIEFRDGESGPMTTCSHARGWE